MRLIRKHRHVQIQKLTSISIFLLSESTKTTQKGLFGFEKRQREKATFWVFPSWGNSEILPSNELILLSDQEAAWQLILWQLWVWIAPTTDQTKGARFMLRPKRFLNPNPVYLPQNAWPLYRALNKANLQNCFHKITILFLLQVLKFMVNSTKLNLSWHQGLQPAKYFAR